MTDNSKGTLIYRGEVMRLIRDLTSVHYYSNADCRTFSVLDPLTQRDISKRIGVTYATLSRAATGVCSLSGEAFFFLVNLHRARLGFVLDYKPLAISLPIDYD